MLELQNYLLPVSAESPCGADLTYDNDFQALENAAREKPEQQFGDTVIPAEPPDWREVERQATALLARTRDLRITALLCRAWTVLHGLTGLEQGLHFCAAILETHWDNLHPQPEDGDDYFMRMNALAMLSDVTGFIRDLRDTDFLKGALGQVSVRDAEALAKGGSPEDNPSLTADELRNMVSHAHAQEHSNLIALSRCIDSIDLIRTICSKHLAGNQMPDTEGLYQLLQTLCTWMPTSANSPVSLTTSDPGSSPAPLPQHALTGLEQPSTASYSRDKMISLLLEIANHVEKLEPANPAPLFIRRGARFMGMSFIDIVKELSPDSLPHVELVTGVHARDA